MIKDNVVRYLSGKFKRAELKKVFLPATALIVFGFLLIAYLFYPPALDYSFFSDTISGLGDFIENPRGWWGFSIAIWTLSVSFFSLFLYIHRRLGVICRKTARFGTFFALVGCIGLFMIGFIVDATNAPLIGGLFFTEVHLFFAWGGFGGLAIGVITYGFIFLKDTLPRLGGQQLIPRWRPLAPYLISLGAAVGMGISQGLKDIIAPGSGWNGPGLLALSFWEWMLLFGIIIWVFWIVLILPEEIPAPRNSTR